MVSPNAKRIEFIMTPIVSLFQIASMFFYHFFCCMFCLLILDEVGLLDKAEMLQD